MSDAPLPSSFDGNEDFYSENRWQKLTRRLKEEPLIPLGCFLTCWALFGATRSMRTGDSQKTNRMFRRRIYAQGFTIISMYVGSMYWKEDREKRKEYENLSEEKKRLEKRDAWIRELEARDEEDKAMRAKMEKLKQRKKESEAAAAAAASKEASETRSALEGSEERGLGVMEAVRALLANRK
ncbi:uncharacterized protein K452DRAFT_251677 [Aplosporella prunicola CBS 121167]|uniref:HIG1 domain-containing protein n=1 Tax=Aplosporella prunicola CBS 121167 TaxID=1176127 RepID=A0A6A6BBZ7_9PEZI|nr:uncharacterized protein K452DRAFT_251677 [Aplosporella prunicola CBS 121167]KAF2140893.1 hypothetical protein K452DRAFT_251677 [Aplosporella prunicola CBS 121167]